MSRALNCTSPQIGTTCRGQALRKVQDWRWPYCVRRQRLTGGSGPIVRSTTSISQGTRTREVARSGKRSSHAALIDTSLHFHARSDSEAGLKPQGLFRGYGDCMIDRSFGGQAGLKDVRMSPGCESQPG